MTFVIHRKLYAALAVAVATTACGPQEADEAATETPQTSTAAALVLPGETHLRNVRQLTFGGDNAEAYYSFDGTKLIYQHRATTAECDQIYILDIATAESRRVSTGDGRTTCSYFYPSGDQIVYASTHHHDAACPAPPDMSKGYVWPINDTYDIFLADADGSNLRQLTDVMGYDAEATVSPTGDRVIFTSVRDGDLELYSMNLDGTGVTRLTDRIGYDGGAFFSPDGTKIVWRAHYPEEGPEKDDYLDLLSQGLIRPGELEVWIMNADGSDKHQVTELGGANFAPYWHPSGNKIIWSSNHLDPNGREFELFMSDTDGANLEQVTFSEGFDGFPVFSPDGTHLVFASNRNNGGTNDTNVFIAEWVEDPGM
jgi:Tol biopolymer transport system component